MQIETLIALCTLGFSIITTVIVTAIRFAKTEAGRKQNKEDISQLQKRMEKNEDEQKDLQIRNENDQKVLENMVAEIRVDVKGIMTSMEWMQQTVTRHETLLQK